MKNILYKHEYLGSYHKTGMVSCTPITMVTMVLSGVETVGSLGFA